MDQDTPLVLCEIGKRSQTEESEFCFLQIILLSDNIYFTLRERDERVDKKGRTQPRKALGVGKIDLKKLYDQISIGTLQKQAEGVVSGQQLLDYTVYFYSRLE